MRYYTKRKNSTESICINKINRGIQSLTLGLKTGDEVGEELETFFNTLKGLNEGMYDELFMLYCVKRLEKEIKEIHS